MSFSAKAGDDPDRAAAQSLMGELTARIGAAVPLRAERKLAARGVRDSRESRTTADAKATAAELAWNRYIGEMVPFERRALDTEIGLAEGDVIEAQERTARTQKKANKDLTIAELMSLHKAEIQLTNARMRKKVLDIQVRRQVVTSRELVAEANAFLRSRVDQLDAATRRLSAIEGELAAAEFSADEAEAAATLAESLALFDDGEADAARAKLDAARAIWENAQRDRSKVRPASTRR